MPTDTITSRIAAGAAMLDKKIPDWRQKTDPRTLDMSSSGRRHLLGQVYPRGYFAAVGAWDLTSEDTVRLGFDAADPADKGEWAALTNAWKTLLGGSVA